MGEVVSIPIIIIAAVLSSSDGKLGSSGGPKEPKGDSGYIPSYGKREEQLYFCEETSKNWKSSEKIILNKC